MTPERWRKVEELYDAALEKTTHERALFLVGACPEDSELRREVEKLVRRAHSAGSPLDTTPMKLLETSDAPPGTKMGPYQIVELAGVGGMGRVYKAIDTRLDRVVALKVSKSRFSERFQREARAIAALSHPNICTLFDVGPDYLVMEFLEGAPLQGPMPLEKALAVAIAVAGALSTAHRAGVVHCDLKPANILLTRAGPKLLDFGLARVEATSSGPVEVPAPGLFAGTVPYMAPEQMAGGAADSRSDIYAFGVTLFELISGHRPGSGESLAGCPPALQHLLDRCLARDPESRWQSARDVETELEWISRQPNLQAPERPRRRLPLLPIAAALVLAAAGAWLVERRPEPDSRPVRFTILPPEGLRFATGSEPLLSPDGRRLLFTTTGTNYVGARLWLHDFTTGATAPAELPRADFMAWSPGGDSVLEYSSERLLRVDLSGGGAELLREPLTSIAVAPGGSLLLGIPGKGLFWAPPNGERKLAVPRTKDFSPVQAQALPNGDVLVWVPRPTILETWIAPHSGLQPQRLLDGPARYAPPGYLLYTRGDTLLAQPFDARRGRFSGAARSLLSGVGHDWVTRRGLFAVSDTGVLVFLRDRAIESCLIEVFNRNGRVIDRIGGIGDYVNPALSPDGRKLAVSARGSNLSLDILVFDLVHGGSQRIASQSPDNNNATWSPDGSTIAFSAEHQGVREIHGRDAAGNGPERVLLRSGLDMNPLDWSSDGRVLLYNSASALRRRELWTLPVNPVPGESSKPSKLIDGSTGSQNWAAISPNRRWLAYRSMEDNIAKIYLSRFPTDGSKWEISPGSSRQAAWRGDSGEIYFDLQGSLMAMDFHEMPNGPVLGAPRALFPLPTLRIEGRNWFSVMPDGQRFVIIAAQAGSQPPMEVVLNWPRLLESK